MSPLSRATALTTLLLILAVMALTLGPRVVSNHALGGDKIQHALGFGSIIAPAALARPGWLWRLVPLAILFGGLIEIGQHFVGRDVCIIGQISPTGLATAGTALVCRWTNR